MIQSCMGVIKQKLLHQLFYKVVSLFGWHLVWCLDFAWLRNLTFILSHPVNVQMREPYSADFMKNGFNTGLLFDSSESVLSKLDM